MLTTPAVLVLVYGCGLVSLGQIKVFNVVAATVLFAGSLDFIV